jgi:hypothetical protein
MHTNTGVVACKQTDKAKRRLRVQWKIYSFSTQSYKMHIGYTIGVLCVQKLTIQPLFMYVKLLLYVKQSFMCGRDNICKDVIPEGRILNAVQHSHFYYKKIVFFYKTATCYADIEPPSAL